MGGAKVKHRDGTADRRAEVYRDALATIAREYSRDLQIDDVAHAVASSRRQLQRVFAEVGGTSFRELLATARMHEAKRLLAHTDLPVQDVAARVGYHQSAQFSKSFRRHFGTSPRVFRKRPQATAAIVPPARRPTPITSRAASLRRPPLPPESAAESGLMAVAGGL
jgi:two-component system response regulator YesN